MGRIRQIDKLVQEFSGRRPIRSGSLLLTMFGDVISKHGGNVWLGSVINALEPFGLNSRLVRTAVFRLVKDEWLTAEQIGRRSYYKFTDAGRSYYQKSACRIYSCTRPEWSGDWTLVFYSGIDEGKRTELQKQLKWMGYGQLVTHCMAHPNIDPKPVEETLEELGLADQAIVMRSKTLGFSSQKSLRRLVRSTWELEELGQQYQEYLDCFRPILGALRVAKSLDLEQCFQLRLLLIHEYRRVILNDSDLPDELMSENWPGNAARTLTANIYKAVHGESVKYIMQNFESADGPLPNASASYYGRFGGLRN